MAPFAEGRFIYQLHSLGAAGAPPVNGDVDAASPTGCGLARLQTWLDHVAGLGCRAVLLTPIFVSSTHGYDTVDPFRIDQRLGDEDDFTAFAAACHERDLSLVLDGVFNHVGREFGPFRDVRSRGPASEYADWFRIDFDRREQPDGFAYRSFEGHHDLVTLNHHNGAVLDWAISVATYWLDRGADGWRVDAAYAIPTAFLAGLTTRVRNHRPDAFVFGEVIHGDYAGFVEQAGLESVTQYELYKAMWSSINDANFFELAWALKRHQSYTAAFTPVTFAGNHDVTRLASQLHDPTRVPCALAVLCTAPGVPCLYYGDEFGWRGIKEQRPGGDDAIRPPLPPTASPADEPASALEATHRRLIGLRRARPWLTRGDLEVGSVTNRRIVYTVSSGPDVLQVTVDLDGATEVADGWRPVEAGPGYVIAER